MKYNVVMFAYNEEKNITSSISSVFESVDESLNKFYLIANGCTDNTVEVAKAARESLGFERLHIEVVSLGDKCNAWNKYMHELADDVHTHFFVDADVNFSRNCFPKLNEQLISTPDHTVAIAGLPLTGRNLTFYRELVLERSCFFGNLYGVKNSFVKRIREANFRLPIGLNWIDSFLTKAVNTDLKFEKTNLPERTTWLEGVGYSFESLSVFKKADITLYLNRIARYELGKLQETILDGLTLSNWPSQMHEINKEIWKDFANKTAHLSWFQRCLVKRRLNKLLSK
jgi:glycosyltransferase involved in cell wall biosynthesis